MRRHTKCFPEPTFHDSTESLQLCHLQCPLLSRRFSCRLGNMVVIRSSVDVSCRIFWSVLSILPIKRHCCSETLTGLRVSNYTRSVSVSHESEKGLKGYFSLNEDQKLREENDSTRKRLKGYRGIFLLLLFLITFFPRRLHVGTIQEGKESRKSFKAPDLNKEPLSAFLSQSLRGSLSPRQRDEVMNETNREA